MKRELPTSGRELPTFLRIPDPPYYSTAKPPIGSSTFADLVELWSKTGTLERYRPPPRQLRPADLIGVLAMVAVLAFCLGYYLAS